MHALLYRSRAKPDLTGPDLNDILQTARGRNRRLGITGLLLHGRMEALPMVAGEFVQWIEGPEETVEALFRTIEADPRHFEVEVLGRGAIPEVVDEVPGLCPRLDESGRLFPTWSMGLVQLAELPATLPGFLHFTATWDGNALTRAA